MSKKSNYLGIHKNMEPRRHWPIFFLANSLVQLLNENQDYFLQYLWWTWLHKFAASRSAGWYMLLLSEFLSHWMNLKFNVRFGRNHTINNRSISVFIIILHVKLHTFFTSYYQFNRVVRNLFFILKIHVLYLCSCSQYFQIQSVEKFVRIQEKKK